MIKRRGLGFVVLAVVLSVSGLDFREKTPRGTALAAPVAAPPISPIDVVTSSLSRGLASLRSPQAGLDASEEQRAEIGRAAHDLFDVNDMARRALGQHWKGLLPGEQHEFVRLFSDVLAESFAKIVEQHAGDNAASLDEEVAGTLAQVRSLITPEQGSEIAIEYRLFQSGGQWAVYDIMLDGVSLVSSYRTQFNSVIGTSSVAQLLERMRTEQSRRTQSRDAIGGATTAAADLAAARRRLAAGLLLGAASQARWR